MTNLAFAEMRSLSSAEIDAVAGGLGPAAAAAAGVAIGTAVGGAILAAGLTAAVALIAVADAASDDEEPVMAPGTDENGDFIE